MKTPEKIHDHREDIGCLKAIEMFYAYLDGELEDPEAIAQFEHHLEHCRSCYSRTEFEDLLMARLKAAGSERAPDILKSHLRVLMKNF